MKIKTKLVLGVGLLFLLIVLLTVVSTWYINALKTDTNNILTANYNSLEYSRNMILALDGMAHDPQAIVRFENNLAKQKKNETEPGEKAATRQIAMHFDQIKPNPRDTALKPVIRKEISELMLLNMDAIERKSQKASHTSQAATVWIALTGTLCFLIAFILFINLPGSIANPIRELTESIRQIAEQKYQQRVHFESHSEFGELAKSFNTMAEKLEEYAGSNLARVLMEKKRIETLINNMNDPVLGLDEYGKILFVNENMLKIAGYGELLVGENISQAAEANDLIRMFTRDIADGQLKDNVQPLGIFVDGKENYFEKEIIPINIVPTGEKTSVKIGHVIILKNITSFKELDYAKTNFIATISHELKTPISSIQMGTQLLENDKTGSMNDEQKNLLKGIQEDSNRLLKITSELLNMTQVETGNIQLNIQQSSPYEVLGYALAATRAPAEQRNILLEKEAGEDVPNINIDPEKTAWVLTNFINNAIRYSPENGQITVSLKKEDNDIIFSVQDFGKGIENRYKTRIFDRYFQIPGSSKSGSGLGLAISKDFIEAQGGHIGLESEQGMGSTFFFSFPSSPV